MIRKYIIAAAALVAAGSTAMAADISYDAAPAPIPAQTYNWTGFYVGLTGGLASGDTDLFITDGEESLTLFSGSSSGFIGGVQVGYDWQFENNFVLGAVADISASDKGFSWRPVPGDEVPDLGGELKYLGTVRARAGYAWDRALVYAHGGFAYGKVESYNLPLDANHTGWTIGAGIEYALTDKISFGTEYAYVDLGDELLFSDTFEDEDFGLGSDVKFHTVKAMINFRF